MSEQTNISTASGPATSAASDHGAAFAAYLSARRPLIEEWLATHAWTPKAAEPAAADLERYLYAPLAHYNAGGGKRVRPALALLGAEAVGGNALCALASGCAIELFQSAALIHDDIADKGELRRGEPCLHLTIGLGLAINAGDTALVEASDTILSDESLAPSQRLRVIAELMAMERRTLEGQALDLGWVRDARWDISSADYLTMATHKTAHYSAATPLAMGAICAGGTNEQVEALRAFGLDAGLAFQIQDDLLNLVGDAAAQGKDFRSDITEGKRTLVVTKALELLGGAKREELVGILSAHATDERELARAVELMEGAGAVEFARDYALGLAQGAQEHLSDVKLTPEARQTLVSMANFFVERTR